MSKVIYIKCNKGNYDNTPRPLSSIIGCAFHYTANKGDLAVNNGNYFKNNVTKTSAHYFIDGYGNIVKSVPYSRPAWAVGKPKAGVKFNNYNTISIELCDIKDKYPTKKQIAAARWLIKYLRKRCPNMKNIVRHYDISGKLCPATMVDDNVWNKFLKDLNL